MRAPCLVFTFVLACHTPAPPPTTPPQAPRGAVASRHNADGTVSFVLIAPGLRNRQLVTGPPGARRTLTIRDGQHEYQFTER
jgi:hypothetical protein